MARSLLDVAALKGSYEQYVVEHKPASQIAKLSNIHTAAQIISSRPGPPLLKTSTSLQELLAKMPSLKLAFGEQEIKTASMLENEGYKVLSSDSQGRVHSFNDNPAATKGSKKFWFNQGIQHRENDLPAIVSPDSDDCYLVYGYNHRVSGKSVPALFMVENTPYLRYHLYGSSIDPELFGNLLKLALEHKVPLYMVYLASFNMSRSDEPIYVLPEQAELPLEFFKKVINFSEDKLAGYYNSTSYQEKPLNSIARLEQKNYLANSSTYLEHLQLAYDTYCVENNIDAVQDFRE